MACAPLAGLAHRQDVVVRLVQGRTNQIVHRGVDDDEILGVAMLHVDHAADENTGVADDHPPRLEHQRAAEIVSYPFDHGRIGGGHRRRLAIGMIGNPQTAAEIDMRDGVSIAPQGLNEFGQNSECRLQRHQIGDLAADVNVHAGDLDTRQLRRARINLPRAGKRHAELVFGSARRNFRVAAGIHIGIDPNRNPRRPILFGGQP